MPQGAVKYGEVLCYFLSLPRPVICLGIYRTVGILDNLTPYVYTKPDINSLVFSGDRIIILGEIQSRDHSPLLKFLGRKQKENVLNI